MDAASVQPTSVRDEALGILSRLGAPQSVLTALATQAIVERALRRFGNALDEEPQHLVERVRTPASAGG
jgi:hypothetical protein